MEPLPDHSLRSLALSIGSLPDGDIPAAWYSSMSKEVIEGYERYKTAVRAWNEGYAELLAINKLPPNTPYLTQAHSHFSAIVVKESLKSAPRWLRYDSAGHLVPRKRTTAEKTSKTSELFFGLRDVPTPTEFVTGMPDTLWTHSMAYPVHIRKPGNAVLAFVGTNPDDADPAFEVGPEWSRMKISTFHLLRERQAARAVHGPGAGI